MKIESSKEKIESLRELINTIIVSENYDPEYLVEKSQELDILIVQAIKEMNFIKKVFGDNFVSEIEEFEEVENIIDKIKRFEKNYYSMRIVDPITKEVLELKKGDLYKFDFRCYEFFGKHGSCENCISKKACNNGDIIMKIENFNNKSFMVLAIPILIHNKKLSVELLKDITEEWGLTPW